MQNLYIYSEFKRESRQYEDIYYTYIYGLAHHFVCIIPSSLQRFRADICVKYGEDI